MHTYAPLYLPPLLAIKNRGGFEGSTDNPHPNRFSTSDTCSDKQTRTNKKIQNQKHNVHHTTVTTPKFDKTEHNTQPIQEENDNKNTHTRTHNACANKPWFLEKCNSGRPQASATLLCSGYPDCFCSPRPTLLLGNLRCVTSQKRDCRRRVAWRYRRSLGACVVETPGRYDNLIL